MKNEDIFKKLQFNEQWIDLGIITPELLNELKKDYETGDDNNAEHYRWRAFSRFINSNKILPPETIKKLYELGNNDPDETMGGAIMRELMDRKDCPIGLLKIASQSNKDFLVKAANRAIGRRVNNLI